MKGKSEEEKKNQLQYDIMIYFLKLLSRDNIKHPDKFTARFRQELGDIFRSGTYVLPMSRD